MSGNEKGPTDYAINNGPKSGYSLAKQDTFALNTELQNYGDKEKFVWEAITYEIAEGARNEYTPSKIVWLTIGKMENPSIALCHFFNEEFPWGPTNLTGRDQPMVSRFSEHSAIWRSDKDGMILQAAGHLHDGGENVLIIQNGEVFCDSKAKYEIGATSHSHNHGGKGGGGKMGAMPAQKRQLRGGNYSNTDIPHISELGRCDYTKGRPLRPGDGLYIQANYDLTAHPAVKNGNGSVDMIMGMAGVLIASKDI
jgi:hypothetical protein